MIFRRKLFSKRRSRDIEKEYMNLRSNFDEMITEILGVNYDNAGRDICERHEIACLDILIKYYGIRRAYYEYRKRVNKALIVFVVVLLLMSFLVL